MENNEVTLFRCLKKNRGGGIEKNDSKYMNFKSISIPSMMGSKAWLYVTIMTSSYNKAFFGVLFVLVSFLLHVFNLWNRLLLQF